MQSSHAYTITSIRVRAALEQILDDFMVPTCRCDVQRKAVIAVWLVRVRTCLQQGFDRSCRSVVCRTVKHRSTVISTRLRVCPRL